MYFLTHLIDPLLVRNLDSDMARPLDDAISTALGTRHDTLQRTPFVDEDGGYLQVVHVSTFIVLGVGHGRLQHFLDDLGGFLVAESQQVERIAHLLPADLVGDQAGFLGGDASARQLSGYFHRSLPLSAWLSCPQRARDRCG